MKHLESGTYSVSEQQRSSPWRRLRQWLGERSIRQMTEEAKRSVGESGGNESGGRTTTIDGEPPQKPESGEEQPESDEEQIERIMAASEARYKEETKWEAGGPMGILPQLVIGPQRYPSPKMWGPEKPPDDPLTIDEEYGKVVHRLDELDRRTGGFDGTRSYSSND